MNKWIAEFDLEDGDTMPEHIDLEYRGVKIDFHCRPKEPVLDKIRAEIEQLPTEKCTETCSISIDADVFKENVLVIIDKYKAESEE